MENTVQAVDASFISPMLALYRSDHSAYQPTSSGTPFKLEDGNPQASLENLRRLTDNGLVIQDIWVRNQLRRVLIQFSTGEQYLALGLSDPETLARLAAEANMGKYDDLRANCDMLAEDPDYDDKLPEE